MDVNSNLTVDGSVTASGKLGGGVQATSAGDAVLLGDDGLIPASLLPNTGGEQWEEIPYDSTLVEGDVYKSISPAGINTFIAFEKSNEQYVYYPGNISSYIYIKNHVINKMSLYTTITAISSTNLRLYHLVE